MQVGAIGSASFMPYIYNTNNVSRASMNKIQGIGEDLLDSKTDFSALSSQENINPLKKGQTLDFAGIMSMQMEMSRMNAARVMKEPEKEDGATQAAGVASVTDAVAGSQAVSVESVATTENTQQSASVYDYAKAMAAYQPLDLFA